MEYAPYFFQKTAVFFLFLGFVFGTHSPRILADSLQFSVGSSFLQGDDTYQIGGRYYSVSTGPGTLHFPLSELKFPANSRYPILTAQWQPSVTTRLTASFGEINRQDVVGLMLDSDWGVWAGSTATTLDIFSTSRTTLHLKDYRVKMEWLLGSDVTANPSASTWIGLSYRYQARSYLSSDIHQIYPSRLALAPIVVPGPVIQFDRTLQLPAVTLRGDVRGKPLPWLPEMVMSLGAEFAPFATVKDRDDHLLRSKLSITEFSGHSISLSVNLTALLTSSISVSLGVEQSTLDVTGRQTQSQYGVGANSDTTVIIDAVGWSRGTVFVAMMSFR